MTNRAPSHTRSPRRRPDRGVTLIESLVVVAVLAIVATLSVPSLRDGLELRRLHGTAGALATDLRFVRAEALARGEPLRLSLRPALDGSCYVIHTGTAPQCTCADGDGPALCTGGAEPVRTVRLPLAERITLQGNVGSMLFDPARGTTTPTGTWRVVADGSGRAVHHVVSVMGRVRSCSPDAAVAGYRPC